MSPWVLISYPNICAICITLHNSFGSIVNFFDHLFSFIYLFILILATSFLHLLMQTFKTEQSESSGLEKTSKVI